MIVRPGAAHVFHFRGTATAVICGLVLGTAALPAAAGDSVAAPAPVTGELPKLTAKDAGTRYGQALGAIEICYGSKVTDKAKALEADYAGAELEDFKTQAAKVLEKWLKVKDCRKQNDPNQCKIIMDKSCLAAEAEIGPAGTAMPGLVEFMKH